MAEKSILLEKKRVMLGAASASSAGSDLPKSTKTENVHKDRKGRASSQPTEAKLLSLAELRGLIEVSERGVLMMLYAIVCAGEMPFAS